MTHVRNERERKFECSILRSAPSRVDAGGISHPRPELALAPRWYGEVPPVRAGEFTTDRARAFWYHFGCPIRAAAEPRASRVPSPCAGALPRVEREPPWPTSRSRATSFNTG